MRIDLHISDEKLKSFDLLSDEELIWVSKHVENCSDCVARLAEYTEKRITAAPRGFSENIAFKIKQRKKELLFYSIRVVATSVVAVLLVMLNVFSFENIDFNKAEKITEKIQNISWQLDLGGDNNEKTAE